VASICTGDRSIEYFIISGPANLRPKPEFRRRDLQQTIRFSIRWPLKAKVVKIGPFKRLLLICKINTIL